MINDNVPKKDMRSICEYVCDEQKQKQKQKNARWLPSAILKVPLRHSTAIQQCGVEQRGRNSSSAPKQKMRHFVAVKGLFIFILGFCLICVLWKAMGKQQMGLNDTIGRLLCRQCWLPAFELSLHQRLLNTVYIYIFFGTFQVERTGELLH